MRKIWAQHARRSGSYIFHSLKRGPQLEAPLGTRTWSLPWSEESGLKKGWVCTFQNVTSYVARKASHCWRQLKACHGGHRRAECALFCSFCCQHRIVSSGWFIDFESTCSGYKVHMGLYWEDQRQWQPCGDWRDPLAVSSRIPFQKAATHRSDHYLCDIEGIRKAARLARLLVRKPIQVASKGSHQRRPSLVPLFPDPSYSASPAELNLAGLRKTAQWCKP